MQRGVRAGVEVAADDGETFGEWLVRTQRECRHLLAVPVSFFEDDFNLTDLAEMADFEGALALILDDRPPDRDDLRIVPLASIISVYSMAHQRFLLTRAGLHEMYTRWMGGEYGTCPRHYCRGSHLLPYGPSVLPLVGRAHRYCPHCQDVYETAAGGNAAAPARVIDGCAYGPTYVHLLLMQYRANLPASAVEPHRRQVYTPRIFGFRLCNADSKRAE